METTTNIISLETKVAEFKVIARNALRMKLISPRLSRIAIIESEIKDGNEKIERTNHNIKVAEYEKSKLDAQHPNFEASTKTADEEIAFLKSKVEDYTKLEVEITRGIDEQKKAIALIETGETKVSLEDLNDLVDKMIKQDAYNQIKA